MADSPHSLDVRREALRLIGRMDVTPCKCKFVWRWDPVKRCDQLLPCRHVFTGGVLHGLTLDEWAEFQRLLAGEDYDDPPPPPPCAARALETDAVVVVYKRRRQAKLGLFRDDDFWRRQPTDDSVRVGPKGERAANGADISGGIAVAGEVPLPPQPSLADQLAPPGSLARRLLDLAERLRLSREGGAA